MPKKVPQHKPPCYGPAPSTRAYRKAPGRREVEAIYNGRPWRKLSLQYKQAHPLCAECEAQGIVTPAEQVHHIKDIKDHPDLVYDWDNLQSLCTACHNSKRRKA